MKDTPAMQTIESTRNLGVLEQLILIAFFVLLCLTVYFLYHIGNRHVEQERRLHFTKKHIKLIFFVLLGILALWWLMGKSDLLMSILTPFIIAGVFAYAFNPVVKYLIKLGLSRLLAVIIIFIVLIGALTGFSIVFFPMLVEEITNLASALPGISESWYERVSQWYESTIGEQPAAPDTIEGVLEYFNIGLQSVTDWFSRSASDILSGIGSFASSMVHIVTIPVLTFYFMKDGDDITDFSKKLILPRSRKWVFPLMHRIDDVLGGFIRGQLLVALIIGILSSIALLILGVDYWIVLGLLAGIGDLVPYIGPFLGAVPAVFITLATDPMKALWVVVAFIIIQQIEGNLISPKIVGHSVGLHPAFIIFVLLVGGALWGLVGLLVSVPLAGVLKVIIESILSWFRLNYPKWFRP